MEELVENYNDLFENMLVFNSYENGNEEEQSFFIEKLRSPRSLVAFKAGDKYYFVPSKFAGYKENDIAHLKKINKRDGRITTPRIKSIISEPIINDEIEQYYLKCCLVLNITPYKQIRKYWLIDERETLEIIASELNFKSSDYEIGNLQTIRKDIGKRKTVSKEAIFKIEDIKEDYAFHYGGSKEFQFNIGLEYGCLRYGIAFSFQKTPSIHDFSSFESKINKFNSYISNNYKITFNFKMWDYENNTPNYLGLSRDLTIQDIDKGSFIFFGNIVPLKDINFDQILQDFDDLLDFYKFVENDNINSVQNNEFVFTSGNRQRKSKADIKGEYTKDKMLLRHNDLQSALYDKLEVLHGKNNVSGEKNRRDIVLKNGDEFWIYEIKTSNSPKACLREAIGQLLEYAYWHKNSNINFTKLIIVGESMLDIEGKKYLSLLRDKFKLPLYYEQFTL